jgi:hypothetical protein
MLMLKTKPQTTNPKQQTPNNKPQTTNPKQQTPNNEQRTTNNKQQTPMNSRLNVLKTYKLYIGGQFPRTESGRFYPALDKKGNPIANMCLASKKDIRESVVAARKAFGGWS